MRKNSILIICMFIAAGLYLRAQNVADIERNWHQWRGPYMTGVSPAGDPPIEWSETKNVKWKTAIPGKGHSTPIIWENKIYISTSDGILIIDVSNPKNPEFISQTILGKYSHILEVSNGYAYSELYNKVSITNLNDPVNPKSVIDYYAHSSISSIAVNDDAVYVASNDLYSFSACSK